MLERVRSPFAYLFGVYFIAAVAETLISPLFPLIRDDLGLEASQQAALTAILTVGMASGNILGGWLGNRLGDRTAVRLAALLLCLGATASAVAANLGVLAIGQVLIGLGAGTFFAPGLASVGRMAGAAMGRVTASYGLAYSIGLAAAAFSSNVGVSAWRLPFVVAAVPAGVAAVFAPGIVEAPAAAGTDLLADAATYLRSRMYRLALLTGIAIGTTHYVVIGFTPEFFESRGTRLALITGLVGVGRLASIGGKVVAGRMFDRLGGPATVHLLLVLATGLGVCEMLLPRTLALVAVPLFVCITAMGFPVANAIVVSALPPRASWGVGLYRASLTLSSAVCSGLVSLALTRFDSRPVMLASLAVPAAVAVAARRIGALDQRSVLPVAPAANTS